MVNVIPSGVFLGLLTLGVSGAGKYLFRRVSGQFVNAPTESFPAASRFACSTRCQEKDPLICSGFIHEENGTCSLYSGEGNCQGPATLPESDQPVTQRWIRSICLGTMSSPCDCPAGFSRCAGRCYKRIPQEVVYSEAESQCRAAGAHLAVPRSEAENQCAVQLAVGDDVWLGVTDVAAEGEWTGKDACGTVHPSSGWWKSGEPNNSGDTNNADCIYIHLSGFWADWDCPTLSFPLCQLNLCHKGDCM